MNIISFLIAGFFLSGLFVLCMLQRKGLRFSLQVGFAAILGLSFGLVLQWLNHEALKSVLPLFTLVTRAYTGALRLLVVPILLLGVILVIVNIYQSHAQKKVYAVTGLATVILFINTALASVIGIGSAIWFSVGNNLRGVDLLEAIDPKYEYTGVWNALIGYIPTNIFEVLSSSNALQVTIVAVLFGLAAAFTWKQAPKLANPFIELVESSFEIVKCLASIIIKFTPYGVFALLTRSFALHGWNILISLGNFVLANTVGFILLFLLQLGVASILGRVSPVAYVQKVFYALSVAFSTRSSFSTIPVTMQTLREKFALHKETSRAIPSIGASIGMNACAGLWPAIVAVATMQAMDMPLTLGTAALIAGANIVASIGISGIPGTATVAASASFALLGLPFTLVPLVQSVDFFIDMGRTALNVNGTITAAVSAESLIHNKGAEKMLKKA